MNFFTRDGAVAAGQARPEPDMSGTWLSVPEAAAYCETQGLSRNIKTIRRWAQRSHARPENAEVFVREQDTENGFRYAIEKTSLDRKIAQELAFDAMRAKEDSRADTPPVPPHTPTPVQAEPDAPGHGLHEVEPQIAPQAELPGEDMPAGDRTGEDPNVRKLEVISRDEGFLREQITQKDVQIAELNEQMRRKDEHISAMLERDKETNILIHRLQDAMSKSLDTPRVEDPSPRLGEGDSAKSADHRDRV